MAERDCGLLNDVDDAVVERYGFKACKCSRLYRAALLLNRGGKEVEEPLLARLQRSFIGVAKVDGKGRRCGHDVDEVRV